MNKRMFEVILIVSVLFLGMYFIFYYIYFVTHCEKYNGLIGKDIATTMVFMGRCRDSLVCETQNIKQEKNIDNIQSWQCTKVPVEYFEYGFYERKVRNLFR